MITGKNYIGSQLIANGDKTYQTFNAALNQKNPWLFVEATPDEIRQATALANQAFFEFQQCTGLEKAAFLNAIADEILALGDELLNVYCQESSLPKSRAEAERSRTIFQLRSFADLVAEGTWVEASIDQAITDRVPVPKPDLRRMLMPLGPVVVFGASNFPLAYSTAGGDTASALAAGCPVIVKSHPMHAGTGELVASAVIKAAQKTKMPEGVFSNLNSCGIEVGVQLVQDPLVKAVGFTGSIKGGRALFDLAAQRPEPIPVFAEMGSINPVIILPEALKKNHFHWAKTYANSITLGTGQFCTNPGLLLGIQSSDLSVFIQELSSEINKIAPSCMLHPSIYENYQQNKSKLSQQENVTIVTSYQNELAPNYAGQQVLTVSGKDFLKNPQLHQEVFGPFSIVVQCSDLEELENIISNLEGQLTGTILAENDEIGYYKMLVLKLQNRVGRLIFNGVPTGVEVCPSMVHGGPYPASSDARFTAVGVHSIKRWVRPISFQNWPNELLPKELK